MGLTQGRCRLLIDRALRGLAREGVVELLPEGLRARQGLPALVEALQLVHRPPTGTQLAVLESSSQGLGYHDLLGRGLAVSADGTRMTTVVGLGSSRQGSEVRFQTLPPP